MKMETNINIWETFEGLNPLLCSPLWKGDIDVGNPFCDGEFKESLSLSLDAGLSKTWDKSRNGISKDAEDYGVVFKDSPFGGPVLNNDTKNSYFDENIGEKDFLAPDLWCNIQSREAIENVLVKTTGAPTGFCDEDLYLLYQCQSDTNVLNVSKSFCTENHKPNIFDDVTDWLVPINDDHKLNDDVYLNGDDNLKTNHDDVVKLRDDDVTDDLKLLPQDYMWVDFNSTNCEYSSTPKDISSSKCSTDRLEVDAESYQKQLETLKDVEVHQKNKSSHPLVVDHTYSNSNQDPSSKPNKVEKKLCIQNIEKVTRSRSTKPKIRIVTVLRKPKPPQIVQARQSSISLLKQNKTRKKKSTKSRRRNKSERDSKVLHNSMERKRRDELKNYLDNIRLLVPGLNNHEKESKVSILKKASCYCTTLTGKGKGLYKNLEKEKKKNDSLKLQLEYLLSNNIQNN